MALARIVVVRDKNDGPLAWKTAHRVLPARETKKHILIDHILIDHILIDHIVFDHILFDHIFPQSGNAFEGFQAQRAIYIYSEKHFRSNVFIPPHINFATY